MPKLLTYYSAKGLTFDSVLLPRLVPGSFRKSRLPETNLLFVGATRATKWVYLSTQQGKALPIIEAMRPLQAAGKLTVQTPRDRLRAAHPTTAARRNPPPAPEKGFGDLL